MMSKKYSYRERKAYHIGLGIKIGKNNPNAVNQVNTRTDREQSSLYKGMSSKTPPSKIFKENKSQKKQRARGMANQRSQSRYPKYTKAELRQAQKWINEEEKHKRSQKYELNGFTVDSRGRIQGSWIDGKFEPD